MYFYDYYSLIFNLEQFTNFHKNPNNSYFNSFPLQTVFIIIWNPQDLCNYTNYHNYHKGM